MDGAGNVALLLASGQVSQAVTLDKNLNVQFSAAVSAANSIVRAGNLFYLLADNAVVCFDASGTQQWSQNLDTSPQALLANSKDLLLFSCTTEARKPLRAYRTASTSQTTVHRISKINDGFLNIRLTLFRTGSPSQSRLPSCQLPQRGSQRF